MVYCVFWTGTLEPVVFNVLDHEVINTVPIHIPIEKQLFRISLF
jgi:hypothetical protein